MKESQSQGKTMQEPLSDLAYDWVTIIQHKSEALRAYEKYMQDAQQANSPECAELMRKIYEQDANHVQEATRHLVEILRNGKMGQGQMSQGQGGSEAFRGGSSQSSMGQGSMGASGMGESGRSGMRQGGTSSSGMTQGGQSQAASRQSGMQQQGMQQGDVQEGEMRGEGNMPRRPR